MADDGPRLRSGAFAGAWVAATDSQAGEEGIDRADLSTH
jgi:hypothetical protein